MGCNRVVISLVGKLIINKLMKICADKYFQCPLRKREYTVEKNTTMTIEIKINESALRKIICCFLSILISKQTKLLNKTFMWLRADCTKLKKTNKNNKSKRMNNKTMYSRLPSLHTKRKKVILNTLQGQQTGR